MFMAELRKAAKNSKWVRLPLGSHWLMLVIVGVLLVLVATFVDLTPVVDQNFFFSTNDPGIQQTKKIEQSFPSQPEVILAVSARDISSPRYLSRIQKLTQRAHTIGGVSAVKSLAEGPKSLEDALKPVLEPLVDRARPEVQQRDHFHERQAYGKADPAPRTNRARTERARFSDSHRGSAVRR